LAGCGTDVKKVPPRDTSGDTKLSASMVYANSIANKVQAYYNKPDRSSLTIINTQVELVHELMGGSNKYVTALKTNKGKTYLKNTMDVFVRDTSGSTFYASDSISTARVNTTRLGYYYYETHIRDLGFGKQDVTIYEKLDISGFDTRSWQGSKDIKGINYQDNTMVVEIAGDYDPYVVRTGIHVNPAIYNAIQVEMKVEGTANIGYLYFFTEDTEGFNAQQVTSFKVLADGNYHTYLIDLSGTGLFNTPLKGIRFDIGSASGEKITFKSVNAVRTEAASVPLKLDKTIHTYSDKMHQEFRLIASNDYNELAGFGFEVRISKKSVAKIQYRDKNGTSSDISKMDGESLEYVAFDIKKVGVVGFIIPPDGSTSYCTLTEDKDNYVFTQYANVTGNNIRKMDDITFGNRVYTDLSHSFAGIDKEAFNERNPLADITVMDTNADAQFAGYDHIRGAYRFTMEGSDFNKAYYREPDKHYTARIKVKSDNNDRGIYIWMNSESGGLECAALLDDTETLIPIPLQVGKNFKGEYEEPFYDPEDNAYGDTFFPLVLKASEEAEFTLLHLYQNWGSYPLKQLSWIQFHVSYYHLSTGVTESNCIAPYYVYGKDGWTLPDFRGPSGIMWTSQPQFNSVGRLYFVSYMKGVKKIGSEYTGTYIRSSGQTYADLDYSYISDCGSYKYTLRHLEFPQTDENRTYYSLRLEFLKDLTIDNVRENFSLFTFDSRGNKFYQAGYLDENNEPKTVMIDTATENTQIYKLGNQNPYFSYFELDKNEDMNFGFILKNSNIKIGKKKYSGGFVFRNTFSGTINIGSLSLDLGKTKFKKGDYIELDFILLPYGSYNDLHDDNVRYVREDSALKPLKIEAIKGEVVKDAYLPRIKCVDNQAEFTISGGRNNNAVRIDGFTNIKKPRIYELVDGEYVPIEFFVHEYDGYSVHFNMDGTYSFSFVFEMESPDAKRTFKIEN
jgi:hypothetical protein